MLLRINNLIKKTLLTLIKVYQSTISPDHGLFKGYGRCKYYPTCSEYTYQSINKYGVIKGIIKGMWRILRCNPFSKGGYDPI